MWEKKIPGYSEEEEEDATESIEVLRFKALINIESSNRKHIAQAVQELYDIQEGIEWDSSEERINKLVFIGKNMDEGKLQASFDKHVL